MSKYDKLLISFQVPRWMATVVVCASLSATVAQPAMAQAPSKPFDPEDLRVAPVYNDRLATASPEIKD
jgi:hypothetical protein